MAMAKAPSTSEGPASDSVVEASPAVENGAAPLADARIDDFELGQKVWRAESFLALVISSFLAVRHRKKIDWRVFAALFTYIDLIGYLPGLARVHQKKSPVIENGFYTAYNLTHTFVTAIPIAFLVIWRTRSSPWSALAIFIHLFGDRGILGNFAKSPSGEFEHLSGDDV